MRARWAVVANVCAASAICAACSSPSSAPTSTGTGSATGTIHGMTLAIADAFSVEAPLNGEPLTELDVALSNVAGLCGASSYSASTAILEITLLLTSTNGSPAVIDQPVVLSIDNAMTLVSYLAQPGSQCNTFTSTDNNGSESTMTTFAVFESATSGTVTITKADATGVTGSFTAVFASGDTLSGSFDAPACSKPVPSNGC
jgi:hypothetical protein